MFSYSRIVLANSFYFKILIFGRLCISVFSSLHLGLNRYDLVLLIWYFVETIMLEELVVAWSHQICVRASWSILAIAY